MKNYLRQRGQAMVEFVLIFPLMCLMFFGVIYAGMFCLDLMTLNASAVQIGRYAIEHDDIADGNYTSKANLFLKNWYGFKGTDNPVSVQYNLSTVGTEKVVKVKLLRSLKENDTKKSFLAEILSEEMVIEARIPTPPAAGGGD